MRIAMPNRPRRLMLTAARSGAVAGLLFGVVACQPGGSDQPAESAAETTSAAETSDAVGAGTSTAQAGDLDLASNEAKASYIFGYRFTENLKSQFADSIDPEAFTAGVQGSLAGEESLVSNADAQKAVTSLELAQREAQEVSALANGREGAAFLADNADREGVTMTDSGLQYEVLTEGSGAKPEVTDTVTTHYEGKLLNGTVFDSSIKRGEPASFPLNGVIPGWTEALQLMPVGSKYRLYIPPDLAYGNNGTRGIPPQSTLIFDVELIGIQGEEPATE